MSYLAGVATDHPQYFSTNWPFLQHNKLSKSGTTQVQTYLIAPGAPCRKKSKLLKTYKQYFAITHSMIIWVASPGSVAEPWGPRQQLKSHPKSHSPSTRVGWCWTLHFGSTVNVFQAKFSVQTVSKIELEVNNGGTLIWCLLQALEEKCYASSDR